MASPSLTERVAALEAEVKELKAQLQKQQPPWTETVYGAFADNPDFHEAMELGRQWRDSFKPKPRKRKKKVK